MNNRIIDLFNHKNWEQIASSYPVDEVVKSISFNDNLRLAYRLLYNDKWEEDPQQYAVELLYEIRKTFPEEWRTSWQHDAFLGMACDITSRFDERYLAYKAAFEKVRPAPPELLIELASCFVAPGDPLITRDEALVLLKQAIKVHPYTDAIGLICKIYWEKKDYEQEAYWKDMLQRLEEENTPQSPAVEPKFLIDEYVMDYEAKK